jgi:hypothetical protein
MRLGAEARRIAVETRKEIREVVTIQRRTDRKLESLLQTMERRRQRQ